MALPAHIYMYIMFPENAHILQVHFGTMRWRFETANSWCSYITYKRHSCNRHSFFSFHPHTLLTVETSLILPESHISAAVYMNYGKRVHNSPVSHAFTRPSNCRRPRRLRALPPFTLILWLKIIRTTATGDIPSSATPIGISLTMWRVIIARSINFPLMIVENAHFRKSIDLQFLITWRLYVIIHFIYWDKSLYC